MNSSIVSFIPRIGVSLPPVFFFMFALMFLDSYKLVKLRTVMFTILYGCCAALVALVLNENLSMSVIGRALYVRYGGPVVEETAKAACIVFLLRTKRIGFMVDAAIYGFAIGSGFAVIENIHYLWSHPDADFLVWLIRGFGTAIMHGGTTAIFAVMSKSISDVKGSGLVLTIAPGLVLAAALHSFFNHFLLPPVLSTVSNLVVLPSVLLVVFKQSEKATRHWLGAGFDSDVEMLELIKRGDVSTTKIGMYLQALQDKFRSEVVADLLCYLRLYLELAVQAKGILLMRQAGFDVTPDLTVQEQFKELRYLGRSIGKTGKLALAPFIHTSSRNLWQLHTLSR